MSIYKLSWWRWHRSINFCRCREVSWSGHGNWTSRSCLTNERLHDLYADNGSTTFTMENNGKKKTHEFSKDLKQYYWHGNEGESTDLINNSSSVLDSTSWSTNGGQNPNRSLKRKALDMTDELDLNLSLSMKSKQKEVKEMLWDEEVDSNLSLSLFSCAKKENGPWVWIFHQKACWLIERVWLSNRFNVRK